MAEEFEQHNKASDKVVPRSLNEIKLKGTCLLASKFYIADLDASYSICYAFVCKEALFSFKDLPPSWPPAVTNILQEYVDVFPQDITSGLTPVRGIEYQIDLIPNASMPNHVPHIQI